MSLAYEASIAGEEMLGEPRARIRPPSTDVELVRRCRGADQAAWRAIYDRHYAFVFRVTRRLGTPPSEADDVAQEVFMVALDKLEQFREGQLSTWLYRITALVTHHHHRKRRRDRAVAEWRARLGLGGAPPTPEALSSRSSDGRAVDRILEQMSPKKREVFALYELEQLSGEAIAERVGIPIGTVWSRLRHGRAEFLKVGRRLGLLDEEARG
jgi:RNA polymerase sigma-70 factor (ECF subfamily)